MHPGRERECLKILRRYMLGVVLVMLLRWVIAVDCLRDWFPVHASRHGHVNP
jgi:hypothetical protein